MNIKTIEVVKSMTDMVTKYILEDDTFGKNEVSVIRKKDKGIICIPTQTNCKIGCTFCHLTGTTRPSKNLCGAWLISVVDYLANTEDLRYNILISFMGVGEPLLNLSGLINSIEALHGKYPNIRFGISTMMPSIPAMIKLTDWVVKNPQFRIKMHLSVHGIFNRESIIKSNVNISDAIRYIQQFHIQTGNPIEYHYTLVDGVNDSVEELNAFNKIVSGDGATVKFLTLSETNGCVATKLTEAYIRSLFPMNIVEFYDPPGRDVGASCGMFNRDLYNQGI